jgi:hypothetical protein
MPNFVLEGSVVRCPPIERTFSAKRLKALVCWSRATVSKGMSP